MQTRGLIVLLLSKAAGHMNPEELEVADEQDKPAGVSHRSAGASRTDSPAGHGAQRSVLSSAQLSSAQLSSDQLSSLTVIGWRCAIQDRPTGMSRHFDGVSGPIGLSGYCFIIHSVCVGGWPRTSCL